MIDKCPWCGDSAWRNEAEWLNYDCGTYKHLDGRLVQSDHCKMASRVARMQPVVDAACEYECQWHSNPNLQPHLHRLRVAVVKYKEGER